MNDAVTVNSRVGELRGRARQIVEAPWFTHAVMILIIVNAAAFGLETYPSVVAAVGPELRALDNAILWVFVCELLLRFFAHGGRFFRDPWSIFDMSIVAIAFLPASGSFSVLRAARVLRALRLISIFPRLRRVVQGLLTAIPGIGSIGAILVTILYVFAVIATRLFGQDFPEWFGTLHASLFSLFQIMTLEGWPDIVRTVLQKHPWAWAFFITYILIATFTVLNLFIAVIVDAMTHQQESEQEFEHKSLAAIRADIAALSAKIDALKS